MQINSFQHINSDKILHKFQFSRFIIFCVHSAAPEFPSAERFEGNNIIISFEVSQLVMIIVIIFEADCSRSALWVTPVGVSAVCLCGVITPAVAIWWKNRRRPWNTAWHWFSLHNSWPPHKKSELHTSFSVIVLSLPRTHTLTLSHARFGLNQVAQINVEVWLYLFTYATPNLPNSAHVTKNGKNRKSTKAHQLSCASHSYNRNLH